MIPSTVCRCSVFVNPPTAGCARRYVYWRNIRDNTIVITYDGWLTFAGQPYSVADEYRLEPGTGTVLVARVAGEHVGAGEAELFELSAVADARVRQAVRDRIEEALLVPGEYLPAVRRLFTASSGQVWLLSYETSGDTLGVWYSVERGDTVTPPRRVLLPEWFLMLDATDTHVWGVMEGRVGHQLRGGAAAGVCILTRTRQVSAES